VDNVGLASLGREHCRYPGCISGSLQSDGVNSDTKANATLSGTTSTLMLARSTIEGAVKNEGEPATARPIDDKDST